MWNDAVDLRDFYATPLGQMARHLIRRRLRQLWPDVAGLSVLGLGYATPYLRQFRPEAQRVLALMPAAQGIVHWPPEGPGLAALVDETDLPLPDRSIDRVLLVHGLECAEHLRDLLREIWRVMADNGRLIAVVPNRRGIWARSDRTPFGQGQTFSPSQLSRLMRDNMFTPTQSGEALFLPPFRSGWLLKTAPAWERVGSRWFSRFAGVVMIEAGKQLYGVAAAKPKAKRRAAVVAFPQIARRDGPTVALVDNPGVGGPREPGEG
jgi:SAM-dependent methyltransferase